MAQRPGFRNIQVQSKQDLYELFDDTYTQSGTNSKAEFLGILIDTYLNPENSNSEKLKKAEESLTRFKEENEWLSSRLESYETEKLQKIFEAHKGEKLVFKNPEGESVSIEIKALPDVFLAILNSVKVK